MGNAANVQSPAQPEAILVKPKEKQPPPPSSAQSSEEKQAEKAPTLTYMSCMEVFDKGNVFTREVAARKKEKFPLGVQPTSEWILAEMKKEWCHSVGEDTTEAWNYVTNPVPHEREKRLDPYNLERDKGNEGMTIEDFMKRPIPKKAMLEKHEVLSLRLYTGPGFSALNKSLRKVEMRFAITARVISIAIVKITEACGRAPRCFRGMSIDLAEDYKKYYNKMLQAFLESGKPKETKERVLPGAKAGGLVGGLMKGVGTVVNVAEKVVDKVVDVAKHNWERAEGFVGPVPFDPAPLSFTTNKKVVEEFTYGKPTGIKLCFVEKEMCRKETAVLKIGVGANVAWVSQYPTEEEVLFPPFTAMLPYALEHRDISNMSREQADDILALMAEPRQFVFMPVTYCCWNTQWDMKDFHQKAQKDHRNFRANG